MKYKVLITTSGKGTRLGDLTKYTNKALVRIGDKPAISYIIESYPSNTEFVITIGYFGEQIKDFLRLVYPNRSFVFSSDEAHSLGYSMLKASKYLQCPFIYHACDTIVNEKIPEPNVNWSGGFKGEGSSQYASFDAANGSITAIYDKGEVKPDFLHIGLVGIRDYKVFWKKLRHLLAKSPRDTALGDVPTLREMLRDDVNIEVRQFHHWDDIGNVESLNRAREVIKTSHSILDKHGENIFFFDNFVVKFFYDEKTVAERVKRAGLLKSIVPKLTGSKGNFYAYKYEKGTLLADTANTQTFNELLRWTEKRLWQEVEAVSRAKFRAAVFKFYHDKTIDRLGQFYEMNLVKDKQEMINGVMVPKLRQLINKIDWDWLTDAKPTSFHGDFILDNILRTKTGFCAIDWRQNFGGLLNAGDKYYDLAKLHHNLTVNHALVEKESFYVRKSEESIECDILVNHRLVECREELYKFLVGGNYDLKKVKVLTALIWLNMSPLHEYPFNIFLYYFGKYHLHKALVGNDTTISKSSHEK